jgi:hypothetical protein
VEVEVPYAVREHITARIKAKNSSIWFASIQNATIRSCQDDPGDVPVEEDPMTLSPQMRLV